MSDPRPPWPPVPEPGLLTRVRAGDPQAQDRWYRQEFPAVFRLCLGFLADRGEAEDLAQDAMLHLLERLDRLPPDRPYRPWRSAVVLNLCRDRLRARSRRARAEARAVEALRTRGSRLPDPSDRLQRQETARLLEEALACLPPREREAFVLRDLEEMPAAEAAQALGVEPSTLRTLLSLARRRLRRLLGPHLAPAPGGDGHART